MILENFGRFAVLESIAEFKTEKRDCGVSVENLEILNQVLCHCGVITIICHQLVCTQRVFHLVFLKPLNRRDETQLLSNDLNK